MPPFVPKTALVTGGGTGIGRALAGALHGRGVQVLVAGRRRAVLEAVCAAHPGMRAVELDVADPRSIAAAAAALGEAHPQLDCVINNAGVQRQVSLASEPLPLTFADAEIDTNLRGLVQCCAAFVPLLRRQRGTLVNVSSGLALSPLAAAPVYCATKAAVRSFTLSLRHQLRGAVRVIELVPPAVQTDLHDYLGPDGKQLGIPLADFLAEAMAGLDSGADEVAVGSARARLTAGQAAFDPVFAAMHPR